MSQQQGSDKGYQQQYYYPPPPQQPQARETAPLRGGDQERQAPPSAPPYYGTFQGNPNYPQPAHPGYAPQPSRYSYQTVQGYPIIDSRSDEVVVLPRLPCCGLGIGWCLFILGWLFAAIPWYVGAIMLLCTRPADPRERVGLMCCTIAAILSLIAAIVGGTTATH